MSLDAFLDVAAHVLRRVELRLLRQEADLDAGLRPRFAFELLVDARHDAQQRRLAGAVQAEHADLGAREEAQGDVAQDDALRRHDLADAIHGVDELGHWEELRSSSGGLEKGRGIIGHPGRRTLPLAAGVLLGCLTGRLRKGSVPLAADRSAVAMPVLMVAERRPEPLRLWRRPSVRAGPPGSVPRASCAAARCIAQLRIVDPRVAEREELESFHRREYVDLVVRSRSETARATSTRATRRPRGRLRGASLVVGGTLLAVEEIMAGTRATRIHPDRRPASRVARRTPPGSACSTTAASPSRLLRQRHGLRRIAYVDIDAHHGDGVFYALRVRSGRALRRHSRRRALPLSGHRAPRRRPARAVPAAPS